MDEAISLIKEKYQDLDISKEERTYLVSVDGETGETEKETSIYYVVSNIPDNEDIQLILRKKEEFEQLTEILERKPVLFKDFLALICDEYIEVFLSPIVRNSTIYRWREFEKPIELHLNYYGNDLKVVIEESPIASILNFFAKTLKGIRRPFVLRGTYLKIYNLKKTMSEGIENDTRKILNSILFDIEFSYGLGLETIDIEILKSKRFPMRAAQRELPTETLELVYKQYIPELLEYFHVGQKVDYLPFKYICYFHIIEYFMDKSAYTVVSKKIKQLILKPDFHLKSDEYIGQAINLFKKENDKYTTDKIKIGRVLREFLDLEEIKGFLNDKGTIDHFTTEHMLQCSKPLKVDSIKLDNENNFFDSLTKRVYSLRCSIVHSNPDFDESKAIPFLPNPQNMEFLRKEIDLVTEIARNVITKSCIM